SVIDPLDKPSIASQVAKDSIYRLLFMRSFRTRNGHIPLIASPTILSPPVTRRPPRSRQPQNFSAYASTRAHLRSDSSWPAVWSFHFCRQRRPEDSETQKRRAGMKGRGAEGKRRRGEGGQRRGGEGATGRRGEGKRRRGAEGQRRGGEGATGRRGEGKRSEEH